MRDESIISFWSEQIVFNFLVRKFVTFHIIHNLVKADKKIGEIKVNILFLKNLFNKV